jgi:hypothetical protein
VREQRMPRLPGGRMTKGQTFVNGSGLVRSRSFRYGTALTVVRLDHGYVERYVVRDQAGHHGLAY